MKKLFLAIVAVFALATAVNAQNAIGVRCGGGQGYGAELSFQKGMGSNRLELDLGLNSSDHYTAFNLTGIYQWTGTIEGNFGWYAGVGASLGYWSWNGGEGGSDSDIALAVAGQAGVEYNFQAIPFQVSLDIRPKFYVIPETSFHWGDVAFGIRYRF